MKTHKDIKNWLINFRLENSEVESKTTILNSFLSNIDFPAGDSGDLFRLCVYDTARKILNQIIREPKLGASLPGTYQQNGQVVQLVFENFEHVQCEYSIYRNDEAVVVNTQQMTWQELTQKSDELRLDGLASLRHADELLAFRDSRFPDGDPTE